MTGPQSWDEGLPVTSSIGNSINCFAPPRPCDEQLLDLDLAGQVRPDGLQAVSGAWGFRPLIQRLPLSRK